MGPPELHALWARRRGQLWNRQILIVKPLRRLLGHPNDRIAPERKLGWCMPSLATAAVNTTLETSAVCDHNQSQCWLGKCQTVIVQESNIREPIHNQHRIRWLIDCQLNLKQWKTIWKMWWKCGIYVSCLFHEERCSLLIAPHRWCGAGGWVMFLLHVRHDLFAESVSITFYCILFFNTPTFPPQPNKILTFLFFLPFPLRFFDAQIENANKNRKQKCTLCLQGQKWISISQDICNY